MKSYQDIIPTENNLDVIKKDKPEDLNNVLNNVLEIEDSYDEDQKFACKVLKKYAEYVRQDAIER